jgi:hypothetical protein
MANKNRSSEDFSAKTGTAVGAAKGKAQPAQQPTSGIMPAKSDTVRRPTQEEIARRAYEIWVTRGKSPVGALEDWLQAEKQLTEAAKQPTQQPGPTPSPTANPDMRGCTTSFLLQERDEFGKVCDIQPDPKTEYVQPEDEKETGGEA